MLEKALAAADEALARDPKLAEGHTVRGSAQFALGRLDEALRSYATAIALDPKNARAHAQLARVHWVGRGDLRAGHRRAGARGRDQPAVRLRAPSARVPLHGAG